MVGYHEFMIFLKYKQPQAEYVQFQRLVFGLVIFAGVLFQMIDFIYIFLILSFISLITTVNYSPTTLLFKLIGIIIRRPLFTTAPQYAQSYLTNRLAEFFEDMMRLGGGGIILYLNSVSDLAGWMMASFIAIAMLISGFFGFCLSSLVYISYKKMMKKLGA